MRSWPASCLPDKCSTVRSAGPSVEEHTLLVDSSLPPHLPCWNLHQMARTPPVQSTQKILCKTGLVLKAVKRWETRQWAKDTVKLSVPKTKSQRFSLNPTTPSTSPGLLWPEPLWQTPAGEQRWCTCCSCTGPPLLGWSERPSHHDGNSSLLLPGRELSAQSKRNL